MTTVVEDALLELDAALADMADAHEGLRDYLLLVTPDTKAAVLAALVQYDRRRDHLQAAQAVLEQLMADGYPTLEIPDVSISALADLQQNERTIRALLNRIHSSPAVALNLTAGDPEQK